MKPEQLAIAISDGVDAAKGGNAVEIYHSLAPYHDTGAIPAKSHYPFGWIIYYALHQSPDSAISPRKKMLARYLGLRLPLPHKLHSMVLTEAIRLYKDSLDAAFGKRRDEIESFSILRFCDLWNLGNLRPGDWRRKDVDGKTLPSTVEKLITSLVDEIETKRLKPSPEITGLVDKALSEFSDSFNVYAQKASLSVLSGKPEEAKALLRKALLLAPGKFHLWSRLAALYDSPADTRLRVALLYKARTAPGQEQFKGKIGLSLARVLLEHNLHGEALWELSRVKNLYKKNGWHIPGDFNGLKGRIPEGVVEKDPEVLYRKVAPLADEVMYSALPSIPVKKTYHKVSSGNSYGNRGGSGVAWRVTDENGNNYWIQPKRFGIDENLPMGVGLTIKLFNGRPVKAQLNAQL